VVVSSNLKLVILSIDQTYVNFQLTDVKAIVLVNESHPWNPPGRGSRAMIKINNVLCGIFDNPFHGLMSFNSSDCIISVFQDGLNIVELRSECESLPCADISMSDVLLEMQVKPANC